MPIRSPHPLPPPMGGQALSLGRGELRGLKLFADDYFFVCDTFVGFYLSRRDGDPKEINAVWLGTVKRFQLLLPSYFVKTLPAVFRVRSVYSQENE